MMRFLIMTFVAVALSLAAQAADAPAGQIRINADQILRGRFVEQRQMKSTDNPIETEGHFVASPGRGLIWGIEKPFPTSTIVTPNGVVQDFGGLAVKLPAKNLHHLYEMVSGALAGDWTGLEADFEMTQSGNAAHWQVLLTPKPGNLKQTYAAITVSGGRYVENIVMTTTKNTTDTIAFTDEALSSGPLAADEVHAFNEGAK